MKPTLCSRCKKNVAVIFITKIENGVSTNEGLCLKCAKELGIKQVDDMVKQMGISDEDIENMSGEMMSLMGGNPDEDGGEDDELDSQTATFPFLNKLFGGLTGRNNPNNQPAQQEPPKSEPGAPTKPAKKKHKFLDTYCLNLTERARAGQLDRIVGREVETDRVIQILNRRQKNNPCLIGEPGVGKTAIAEGLAQKIAAGEVPFKLQDKEVFLLDMTAMVAGTQFRGQFESRMKNLIGEIKACGNIILVIDEVHNLVGAGDAEGSMNAANILKPALSRGEVQVIGATTFKEYRKYIEKDSALERRFQPVIVNEPTVEESVAILRGVAPYYERFHGVEVTPEIARQTVLLSERYITDRFLPDKAIDLLDEACSDENLRNPIINRLAAASKELSDVELELKMLSEQTEEKTPADYERIATLKSRACQLGEEVTDLESKPKPRLAGGEPCGHARILVEIVAAVAGGGPGDVPLKIADKLVHGSNERHDLCGSVFTREKQIETRAAAHGAEINDSAAEVRIAAQECGAQMLDGVHFRSVHDGLAVGRSHAQVKSCDGCISVAVYAGHIDPRLQQKVVDSKTCDFFQLQG